MWTRYDLLPDGWHVYCLHDEDDIVVYVGRSRNLQGRVTAHTRDKDFVYITAQEVPCEWEAHALETRLINELQPRYNRAGRDGHPPVQEPFCGHPRRCPCKIKVSQKSES